MPKLEDSMAGSCTCAGDFEDPPLLQVSIQTSQTHGQIRLMKYGTDLGCVSMRSDVYTKTLRTVFGQLVAMTLDYGSEYSS